jgi:hypothetical protein
MQMFETEAKRKIRKEPAVDEGADKRLAAAFLPAGDRTVEQATGADAIATLWGFGV